MRYIGCKKLLLDNIKNVIDENVSSADTFCDIFSGTATVSRYFKQWYQIYSNDILYFSYVLQKATIENNIVPTFDTLKKVIKFDPIDYLNNVELPILESLPKEKRFFQNTYSPIGNRMYFNENNALRIDYARNKVQEWYDKQLIIDNEYYYLIACIVEGIPFISNISGTYGAYNKKWDNRSLKKYELFRLDVTQNNKQNCCFNCDGVELLKSISGDILYIDPPYNSRQYLSNYHVLETGALYDFPKVKGITGQRPYENKKSKFCMKTKALDTFEELIKNANFKHIILSYSSEGIMSINDISNVMKKYGDLNTFKLYEIPYRRFKSKDTNKDSILKEILIYIRK